MVRLWVCSSFSMHSNRQCVPLRCLAQTVLPILEAIAHTRFGKLMMLRDLRRVPDVQAAEYQGSLLAAKKVD